MSIIEKSEVLEHSPNYRGNVFTLFACGPYFSLNEFQCFVVVKDRKTNSSSHHGFSVLFVVLIDLQT